MVTSVGIRVQVISWEPTVSEKSLFPSDMVKDFLPSFDTHFFVKYLEPVFNRTIFKTSTHLCELRYDFLTVFRMAFSCY